MRAKKTSFTDESSKKKKSKSKEKSKSDEKSSSDGEVDLPDPILGDEPAGRGQHRCGNVPIPPIVCVGGKCPPGMLTLD